jgi:hypothetical protein
VEVDGEAKLLAKDDERTSIDDERDIRKMKMARLLETVLTPLFFFFSDEKCFRMAVGVALSCGVSLVQANTNTPIQTCPTFSLRTNQYQHRSLAKSPKLNQLLYI